MAELVAIYSIKTCQLHMTAEGPSEHREDFKFAQTSKAVQTWRWASARSNPVWRLPRI